MLLSARSGDRYRLVTSPRTVSAGSGAPLDPGEQAGLTGRHQHAVRADGGDGVEHGGEILDGGEVAGNGEEAVVEGDDEAPSRLRLQQSA